MLSFSQIADKILNLSTFEINGEAFRICEIEFYLNSPSHPDRYAHSLPDQLEYGHWYFHKHRTGNYKGGTWKGLDITLGSRANGAYCGILLRSIMNIRTEELVEGPCRTVNLILDNYRVESIYELVGQHTLHVLHNHRGLGLRDLEGNRYTKEPLVYGPRVGLSAKHPEFREKNYQLP